MKFMLFFYPDGAWSSARTRKPPSVLLLERGFRRWTRECATAGSCTRSGR
jgi:hypothetical protein